MGWLYQQLSCFFSENSCDYPEVCVCKLGESQIRRVYQFIVKNSAHLVGKPFLFNHDLNSEQLLSEIQDPVKLVVAGISQSFHFVARGIRFNKDNHIPELGIFIMPNAIAFDFEPGPLWGEIEIESFIILTIFALLPGPESFVRLEQETPEETKTRFAQAIERVTIENKKLIKSLTDLAEQTI